jgi:hypothetical protein
VLPKPANSFRQALSALKYVRADFATARGCATIFPAFAGNPAVSRKLRAGTRTADRDADAHDENGNVMADKTDANSPTSNPPRSGQPNSGVSAEERLEASLPTQEKDQPDPALQLSHGRLSAGSITLVGVLIALVLGVVFYALNSPAP